LLQKIKDENPKAKILLNITSGTPQMILALSMCSARNKSYLSVQTKSPIKSRKPQKLDFDKIFCNKDDGDDAEKRVAGVDFSELKKTILVEQLKALIKEYDYHGAYTLCTSKSNENFFEEKTKSFLRHAHHRFKLDIDEARKANDSEELYPVQYDAARDAFEYYLITKIKMLTSDFNSFAVNIKILAEKLAFCALTEHGTNPDEFSCKEENGEIKLSRDKAPEKLLELLDGIYQTPFNDGGEMNLAARIKCIEYYLARLPEKSVLLNKLNIINNEIANRNLIAHNLKYINEKAFQSTPGKICKSLEILFVKIFPTHITEENFNIYDKLNERIIGSL
jgi:CRISPR type III-A/MTUBE-associated protein Csm6